MARDWLSALLGQHGCVFWSVMTCRKGECLLSAKRNLNETFESIVEGVFMHMVMLSCGEK